MSERETPETKRDPIEYLINAMEAASQEDDPSKHGYGQKRRTVLDAIRTLRIERDEARETLQKLVNMDEHDFVGIAVRASEYLELLDRAQAVLAKVTT